jgi:hypothetical protein
VIGDSSVIEGQIRDALSDSGSHFARGAAAVKQPAIGIIDSKSGEHMSCAHVEPHGKFADGPSLEDDAFGVSDRSVPLAMPAVILVKSLSHVSRINSSQ